MKKILPVFLVLLALCLCVGLASCRSYTKQSIYDDADEYSAGTQVYQGAPTEIVVDWTLGKVILVEDANETAVTVAEQNELPDKQKVHSRFVGGVLSVKFWQSGLCAVVAPENKTVVITYPSVSRLTMRTSSADVAGNALHADACALKTTSGDVIVTSLDANEASMESTSGDVRIESLTADTFSLRSTSGNVYAGSVQAETAFIKTTSGNVSIDVLGASETFTLETTSGEFASKHFTAGEAKLTSTSGDFRLSSCTATTYESKQTSGNSTVAFTDFTKTVSLKSTSGDFSLHLPPLGGATVTYETTSGDLTTDCSYVRTEDVYVFGVGTTCSVSIKTTSGDVTIDC